MYRIVYIRQAAKDIQKLKAAGLTEKARKLVEILRNDPFANPPRYESLVGNLSGYYSRRISLQRRLVYQVINDPVEIENVPYDGTVMIIRTWTHYDSI